MSDIVSKWVVNYKDWNIGITSDNRVFCLKSKTELIEYWNNGTISFRLPKTTKKIGKQTLIDNCELKEVVIYQHVPF